MNLVMFDIDGTLVGWNPIFDELYVESVKECLDIQEVDTNWKRYRNPTDSDVFAQIIEENTGRPATIEDLDAIRNGYVNRFQRLAEKEPHHFREIHGAREMLMELLDFPDVGIAVATGNWEETALIKLRMISLLFPELVIASASDALNRDGIMRVAEQRTKEKFQNSPLDSIVYVGDTIWDVRAAAKNDYHFIGIATSERVSRLRSEGAKWIIPDYQDKENFFNILKEIWDTS